MAYEKDALVQKILDIAEAQLFRHGYKALNLNEVAKEAGISKVTLYKVCESKYVLAEKVVQRFLAAADAEMTALLAGSLPLEEKLRRGIGILSSLYLRMDGRFLADLQSSLPALWQLIDETRKRREQALAALFAEAQQRGEVRADVDAGLLAAALLKALCVGYCKFDFAERIAWIPRVIEVMDSWAVCDAFCSTLRIPRGEKRSFLQDIEYYVRQNIYKLSLAEPHIIAESRQNT